MTEENKANEEENGNKTKDLKLTLTMTAGAIVSFVVILSIWFNYGQDITYAFCEVEFLCSETSGTYLTVSLDKAPNWLGLLSIGYLTYKTFIFFIRRAQDKVDPLESIDEEVADVFFLITKFIVKMDKHAEERKEQLEAISYQTKMTEIYVQNLKKMVEYWINFQITGKFGPVSEQTGLDSEET